MIFWIFVGLLAISVVLLIFTQNSYSAFEAVAIVGTVLFGFVVLVMLVFVINANAGIDGKIAAMQQRYEALTYQVENETYENDNDVGKYELYNQVREWNEDLASGKAMQNDFWLGIFFPNIFDRFDFIELR